MRRTLYDRDGLIERRLSPARCRSVADRCCGQRQFTDSSTCLAMMLLDLVGAAKGGGTGYRAARRPSGSRAVRPRTIRAGSDAVGRIVCGRHQLSTEGQLADRLQHLRAADLQDRCFRAPRARRHQASTHRRSRCTEPAAECRPRRIPRRGLASRAAIGRASAAR